MKNRIALVLIAALTLAACSTPPVHSAPAQHAAPRMGEMEYLEYIQVLAQQGVDVTTAGSNVQDYTDIINIGRTWAPALGQSCSALQATLPPAGYAAFHSEFTEATCLQFDALEAAARGDIEQSADYLGQAAIHLEAAMDLLD